MKTFVFMVFWCHCYSVASDLTLGALHKGLFSFQVVFFAAEEDLIGKALQGSPDGSISRVFQKGASLGAGCSSKSLDLLVWCIFCLTKRLLRSSLFFLAVSSKSKQNTLAWVTVRFGKLFIENLD